MKKWPASLRDVVFQVVLASVMFLCVFKRTTCTQIDKKKRLSNTDKQGQVMHTDSRTHNYITAHFVLHPQQLKSRLLNYNYKCG